MNDTADPTETVPPDRGKVIGQGLSWLSLWTARLLVALVGAAVVLWLLGQLWVGVFPLMIALIVATMLWPPTAWLRARGLPDALAAGLVLLGGLAVFFGLLGAIAPSMVSQSTELARQAAEGISRLQTWMAGPPFNLDTQSLNEAVAQARVWVQDRGGQIASGVLTGASAVGSGVVTLVLVLVLLFLMLKDGPRFLPFVRRVVGVRTGAHVTEVATRSWNVLGGFIRTQALVSGIDAVFIGVGLVVLGVPLAFPLAVLTFFGGFIPIVGAFAVGALSVLVALVSKGVTTALLVLALIVLVQQLEGNVLSPMLQGQTMNLHAGVILLAVTVGSTLFGIVGAFLAVPVTAVIAEVMRYLSLLIDQHSEEPVLADVVLPEDAAEDEPAEEEPDGGGDDPDRPASTEGTDRS